METTKKTQLLSLGKYFLVAVILLFLLLSVKECKRDQGLLPAQKEYLQEIITDTIYKSKYLALRKLYDIKVIPKKLIIYDTVYVPTIEYVVYKPGDKDVTIKDTEPGSEEIKYDTRFLTLYPKASKLLEFDLDKETLKINTLTTTGELRTEEFRLFLDNANYQWYDNLLHRSDFTEKKEKLKDRLSKNISYKGLYFNTGYDLYSKQPLVGLEYNLEVYRFKLGAEINTTFQQENPLSSNVKLGYRIFK